MRRISLNESQFNRLVNKCVKRVIKEQTDAEYWEQQMADGDVDDVAELVDIAKQKVNMPSGMKRDKLAKTLKNKLHNKHIEDDSESCQPYDWYDRMQGQTNAEYRNVGLFNAQPQLTKKQIAKNLIHK